MEPRDALAGEIRSLLLHLSRILQDRTPSQGACESMIVGADRLHRLMAMLVDAVPGLERNLPLMESAIQHLDNALSLINTGYSEVLGLSSPVFYSGARGRPRIVVSPPVLEYLISNRFSVRQVAQLLQVSPSTIRRHMNEFGITVRGTYSSLSNEMLDTIVQRIQEEHPNSGYRLITGHLAAMGYRVQETRVRDSIRRVDPVGVAHRWIRGIRRRTYSVPSPNALWHMDGNHKLIRYLLCIPSCMISYQLQGIYIVCLHVQLLYYFSLNCPSMQMEARYPCCHRWLLEATCLLSLLKQ